MEGGRDVQGTNKSVRSSRTERVVLQITLSYVQTTVLLASLDVEWALPVVVMATIGGEVVISKVQDCRPLRCFQNCLAVSHPTAFDDPSFVYLQRTCPCNRRRWRSLSACASSPVPCFSVGSCSGRRSRRDPRATDFPAMCRRDVCLRRWSSGISLSCRC